MYLLDVELAYKLLLGTVHCSIVATTGMDRVRQGWIRLPL
jgi:hypothetical protein